MSDFFLSADQLAFFRADVARMLPGTCIIQAFTSTSDGAGGVTEAWTPVTGGTVGCRLDPTGTRTGQMDTAALQEAQQYSYTLTLPYNAPISEGYRVSVDSTVYEVRNLWELHSWNVSVRAQIVRVK